MCLANEKNNIKQIFLTGSVYTCVIYLHNFFSASEVLRVSSTCSRSNWYTPKEEYYSGCFNSQQNMHDYEMVQAGSSECILIHRSGSKYRIKIQFRMLQCKKTVGKLEWVQPPRWLWRWSVSCSKTCWEIWINSVFRKKKDYGSVLQMSLTVK